MADREVVRGCLLDQLSAADQVVAQYKLEVLDGVFSPELRHAVATLVVSHCELREAMAGELTEDLRPR